MTHHDISTHEYTVSARTLAVPTTDSDATRNAASQLPKGVELNLVELRRMIVITLIDHMVSTPAVEIVRVAESRTVDSHLVEDGLAVF